MRVISRCRGGGALDAPGHMGEPSGSGQMEMDPPIPGSEGMDQKQRALNTKFFSKEFTHRRPPYVLISKLGKGSYGEVALAECLRTGDQVSFRPVTHASSLFWNTGGLLPLIGGNQTACGRH